VSVRYRDSGVDLERAHQVRAEIAGHLRTALFGGLVPVSQLKEYTAPVLVSSIDGVGTKVRLARLLGRLDGLGEDIVHHCVNDIAAHGASPLFFLDYLAFHRLDPATVAPIVDGIARACAGTGMVLAGGETAEMPSVYPPGHFDIAGAIVGAAEQSKIVDGSHIRPGDVLIGFASSGLHTNGYSLAQAVFSPSDYDRYDAELQTTLGEALLSPHRSYLDGISRLMRTGTVHGMAHITGGGIAGNLSRIIPGGMTAVVALPPAPPLFARIEERGVPRDEMLRVFNMGIGLIAVCGAEIRDQVPEDLRLIGHIEPGERSVALRDNSER
jgi:phosphoribosylformylglycinamidine cyclo-ligase